MKHIVTIDLKQPFADVLDAVLALPPGAANSNNRATEAELKALLRAVYEAANGRHVQTSIGQVPIAPPIAEFLKERPFNAASQVDFLIDVAMNVLLDPNRSVQPKLEEQLNDYDRSSYPRNDTPSSSDRRSRSLSAQEAVAG